MWKEPFPSSMTENQQPESIGFDYRRAGITISRGQKPGMQNVSWIGELETRSKRGDAHNLEILSSLKVESDQTY